MPFLEGRLQLVAGLADPGGVSDVSDRDAADALDAIAKLAASLLKSSSGAYDWGWEIWELAMRGLDGATIEGEHCHGLWLVWGALTDWVELRPDETQAAEAAMRRAAAEWLDAHDTEAKRAYLDRWIYDELGYERPA